MDKESKKNSSGSPSRFKRHTREGRVERVDNVPHQWVLTRIGDRDIAFDNKLLNHILETPQDGIRFYTKNKKFFYPSLYNERRFEEIFTRGEVLKRHDDRNISGHIGHGKLYNQQPFKRMGFERYDKGGFIRGGQDQGDSEEEDNDEEQEEMHVNEEESDSETEVEIQRR
ncbi:hypothetical protein M9H77_11152 [Catharanthus roseus]|uniref:Uncharacterized protein n=1 Tax=Catharanthus roseus TaxID=4058 RepID=A0ACC0BDU2_CATRO|nr:hypothetical protein M9H77_11152 [Catharanthus roseus]